MRSGYGGLWYRCRYRLVVVQRPDDRVGLHLLLGRLHAAHVHWASALGQHSLDVEDL